MTRLVLLLFMSVLVFSCGEEAKDTNKEATTTTEETKDFNWNPENFADKKIIRYQVPGFDQLSLDQKKLVYYLTEAGLSGRDIMWDMNYRYNLPIRRALEHIVKNHKGDKQSDDWKKFMVYTKNVWFSNGIHHHYSMDKFLPDFSRAYFDDLLKQTNSKLDASIVDIMFDPNVDMKKVSLDPKKDLILSSAVNFYGPDVTEKEVDQFYEKIIDKNDPTPISYGLNSRLAHNKDGKLEEQVWKVGGLYGAAI